MWLVVALLLLLARPAVAQPADCAPAAPSGLAAPVSVAPVPATPVPATPVPVLPLAIDIAGRPGVPKGVSGQAYINVPMGAPTVTACNDDPPPPPRDILHGEPGDVLGGPPANVLRGRPSPDLLRGPGRPHVEVEMR
jgi:hypothetical protein